jgi:hypothetical protein
MGRFSSPDEPFNDQDSVDPQSWNLFTYARNNPLANTDPTGMFVLPPPDSGGGSGLDFYWQFGTSMLRVAGHVVQQQTQEVAQRMWEFVSAHRDTGCMAGAIASGAAVGSAGGASVGALGLAGGPVGGLTISTGFLGGGLAGGASGGFGGLITCMNGQGGRSTGGERAVPDPQRPKGVPENWRKVPTKNGGVKWVNPENAHDYVRIRTDGTITQVRNGKSFDEIGNLVDFNSSAAHGITAGRFVFRP